MIAEKLGFSACQAVSGQTYSRKADFAVLQVLSWQRKYLLLLSAGLQDPP